MDGKQVVIRVVREDGLGDQNPVFTFDNVRWLIPSDGLDGFGGVEYSVTTEDYAQYDGAYLLGERVPARDRTITARAYFDRDEARAEAESFFIPRRHYYVHCTYRARTRFFTGRQYAFDMGTDNVFGRQVIKWTCLALEPMWLAEDEKRIDLAAALPKRGFSHLSWVGREPPTAPMAHVGGFIPGLYLNERWLENTGDAPLYPAFEIRAYGKVVNPVISVWDSTGKEVVHVALTVDLKEGDVLIIDFSKRPTSITLNGANAANLIRVGSTLAAGIEVGKFLVKWSADSGDASLHIWTSFRERYTAV